MKIEENRLDVQIRWLVRKDMPEVLEIEQSSFSHHWTEEHFLEYLRQRNVIGMVAEEGVKIVGFMLYELHKSRLRIINFAVHKDFRRLDVGSQMVERLIGKLSQQRRNEIELEVRETNLAAQFFFSKLGFRAVEVLREFYDDVDEDAYRMVFRHEDELFDFGRNLK